MRRSPDPDPTGSGPRDDPGRGAVPGEGSIAPADEAREQGEHLEEIEAVVRTASSDRAKVLGRLALLAVMALAFYVLAPTLGEVFSTYDRLGDTRPLWLLVVLLAEGASFVSLWWLFKLAMPNVSWFTIACSQLASNALTRVVPGGAAAGGALQWRMLTEGEADKAQAASGLTAVSLLSTATLFALPLLVVPTILLGQPVPEGLLQATWIGIVLFLVLAGLSAWLLASDRAVRTIGRASAWLLRHVARKEADGHELGERLVGERNTIRVALGRRWQRALLASSGKWGCDYLALVAVLSAVGTSPRPTLVLLAYVAAQVLAMIPITPGGLGFVEAGLTATLALAGVGAADAALATLVYRLFSFWLPLPAGLVAWGLFKTRARRALAAAA